MMADMMAGMKDASMDCVMALQTVVTRDSPITALMEPLSAVLTAAMMA